MIMVMASLAARGQELDIGHPNMIHLSTNMLYDAALVPNVGVEYAFAPRWSARAQGMFAWWSKVASIPTSMGGLKWMNLFQCEHRGKGPRGSDVTVFL